VRILSLFRRYCLFLPVFSEQSILSSSRRFRCGSRVTWLVPMSFAMALTCMLAE